MLWCLMSQNESCQKRIYIKILIEKYFRWVVQTVLAFIKPVFIVIVLQKIIFLMKP